MSVTWEVTGPVASLAAAAPPELLAILERMTETVFQHQAATYPDYGQWPVPPLDIEQARAAIARAKGGR